MDLRITTRREGNTTVVQVDGRLVADGAYEVVTICQSCQQPLVLDLSNLLSADELGVETLLELRSKGAALHGCSPYIELLLKSGSDELRK